MPHPNEKSLTSLQQTYGDCMGPLGFPMRSDCAKTLEGILHDIPEEVKTEFKTTIGDEEVQGFIRGSVLPKTVHLEKGKAEEISLITAFTTDMDRDVIIPSGADFSIFRKNPIVMFAHSYKSLPVGRALWIKRQKDDDPQQDGWIAKTRYAERPPDWEGPWLPDAVWHMIQEGNLRGKSIGLIPLSVRMPTDRDLDRMPEWKGHRIVEKWLLIEYSVAPVPVNADALVQAIAKSKDAGFPFTEDALDALGLIIPEDVLTLKTLNEGRAAAGKPPLTFECQDPPSLQDVPTFAEVKASVKKQMEDSLTKESIKVMVEDAIDLVRGKI